MIKFRVPATSANLGPGFDCLGLALNLYNTFEIEPSDELILENTEPRFANPDNLFVQAFRKAGGKNLHVRFDCDIPSSRGLGSSAAMIVGGIAAAKLLGIPLTGNQIFELSAEMEGHPDNAAPCIYGGLTACMIRSNGLYLTRKLPLSEVFHFTVLIPDFEVSTHQARSILPEAYPRSVAAGNGAHAVLLTEAFRTGDFELLKEASIDHLHEPYRKTLIPHFEEARKIAESDTDGKLLISGSGSTCLLISTKPLSETAAAEISGLPEEWKILPLQAAHEGTEYFEEGTWKKII
ncbi:MAG: homoserine kinase [Solobacterium sp.]|jgi:homoserine kinase|nr:homoserine kinase [Solobacterium sp.]